MAQMHIPILVDWDDIKDHMAKSDIVEVVRCKDCKYYGEHWYCEAWNNSPGFPIVDVDGYCSLAERREDE